MSAAIDFARSRYDSYMLAVSETKANLEQAWRDHYEAVMAFKKSKMWQAFAPAWEKFLELPENRDLFFAASTYREAKMNLPIADLVATVGNTTLTREQMNTLAKKLRETAPDEKMPMRLSILALAYAAQTEKDIPDSNALDEAYNVLLEERENNSISIDGQSYDYKQLAQVSRLKERLSQDIQSRSKRVNIAIEETRQIGLILRSLKRMGHKIPTNGKKLFIGIDE